MQQRNVLAVAAGLALLGCLSARSDAQNSAPFTIRHPPDGATVREAVPIKVPLGSIPSGGYVSFSIDGQFRVAVAPSDEYRTSEARAARRANRPAVFSYVWDTKAPMKVRGQAKEAPPADGPHTITATLFTGKNAPVQKSSVKVTVLNKIQANPGAVSLRYKYVDGSARNYIRTGQTAIVSGMSGGGRGSGEEELVGMRGNLLYAVEDRYGNGRAIVRNKLTKLSVRQGGQETSYPANLLPHSLYQEVDSRGLVHYQNETPSFAQFAQLGVPVSTTLELPVMPERAVRIGDTWRTSNVSLDIPGTPPDEQPKVTVESKFVGLEWEGGYPTARIHQTFDSSKGGLSKKNIVFGTIPVEGAVVKLERDVYIAYGSGTLVRIDRTLEVTGKSGQAQQATGVAPGFGIPGMMGGAPMPPGGMMGGPGMPGMPSTGGPMGGMRPGGAAMGSPMGGYGAPMPGGGMGMGGPGMPGGAGMPSTGGARGGRAGRAGAAGGPAGMPGVPGRGGMRNVRGGMSGAPGMGGNPYMGGGMGVGRAVTQNTQIQLKSTHTTRLDTAQARMAIGR